MPEITNNPYYQSVVQDFLNAEKRKAELEKDFTADMSDEYAEIKKTIISKAVELIKLGCEFEEDASTIGLIINDDIYEFSKEVIRQYMGDYYDVIFKKEQKISYSDSDTSTSYDRNIDMYSNQMNQMPPYNPWQPYMPMYGMPTYPNMNGMNPPAPYMTPNNRNSQYMEYTQKPKPEEEGSAGILREIANIQKKVILLEEEKDGAKNNASQYKGKYEALQHDYDNKIASYNAILEEKSQLVQLNDENAKVIENINSTINDLQLSLSTANEDLQQKDNVISELQEKKAKLEEEYSRFVNESQRTHDDDVRKSATLEEQIKNTTARCNDVISEKKQLEEKITKLENSIEKLKNDLNDEKLNHTKELTGITESNKKALDQAVKKAHDEDNKKHSEEMSALKKAHDGEIKALNTKVSELEGVIKSSEGKPGELDECKLKLSSLTVENEALKKENSSLKDKCASLEASLNKKLQEIKNLEETLKHSESLAYNDNKTNFKNINAFNNEFDKFSKDGLIVSLIGIKGMKEINTTYGREKGDIVISLVAEQLEASFPNAAKYRIMGDQFVIVNKNSTLNSVQGSLSDVERALLLQDIGIAYGTVLGTNCKDHHEILKVAEANMNKMKNSAVDSNSSGMYDALLQTVSPMELKDTTSDNNSPQEINMDEAIMDFMNSMD